MIGERLRRGLDRHGLAGGARRGAAVVWARVYLDEHHVWYALPLGESRAGRPLEPGLALVEATAEQTELLAGLPTLPVTEARKLRDAGGRLFLVLDADDEPLFSCWIHEGRTPVLAAAGGWLELPPGVVCLEDSVTAAAARGRGIAPAAWSALADRLRDEGHETMITKVAVENVPSRKAVQKASFEEAARMRLRRIGPRRRVRVTPATAVGHALADLLDT